MSVEDAAAYLWGTIAGIGIVWVLGYLTLQAVLGTTFALGVIFILAVIYDEWRHPANAYTGWLARNRS